MMRRFATMSQIVADNNLDGREQQEGREAFRGRQLTGRIVMLDRRCPYDPGESIYMALIATDARDLIRVPITAVEVTALIDFAKAEGGPVSADLSELIRPRRTHERAAEDLRPRPGALPGARRRA